MNFKIKEETKELIKALTFAGILIVLFAVLIQNIPGLVSIFAAIISALAPFLLGFVFTLILVPVRTWIEKTVLGRFSWKPKTTRLISSIGAILIALLMVFGFIMILVPQMLESLRTFVDSFDTYVAALQRIVTQYTGGDSEAAQFLNNALNHIGEALASWLTGAEGGIAQIVNYSVSVAKGIANFFIAFIIAFYLLLDQEKFSRQMIKLAYGYLSNNQAKKLMHLCELIANTFNGFIFGKFVDSLIIGVITWVCMMVMHMPYAPLIAVIVGVTNMIPVFGPFIGAVPCFLILLLISPLKSLEFLIFIVILQQVDGNIIGPRILGGAVGLPTLWIMFAIIVGGALFGIPGMFLGVPVFSVIYQLMSEQVNNNLAEKNVVIK